MKDYLKDDKGFVKIFFSSWPELAGVSPEFAAVVDSGDISDEFLLSADFTDLIRGSYYNSKLAQKIKNVFGYSPVPLLTYRKNSDTKISLYPHQIDAIKFMQERETASSFLSHGIQGGIIMLTMGLGKTLTSIVYSMLRSTESTFPTLIICSKTIVSEWKKNGFEKFFNNSVKVLYLQKYLGKNEMDKIDRNYILQFDFVITTYDECFSACKKGNYHEEIIIRSLKNDKIVQVNTRSRSSADNPSAKGISVIYNTPWERVILDESQRIANPDCISYWYIMAIYGKYKWCLTGTPIKNYETDIWAQFRFCGYTGVSKKSEWKKNYRHYMKEHNLKKCIIKVDYENSIIELPEKIEIVKTIEIRDMEKKCYDYIEDKTKQMFYKLLNGECNFASILSIFTRMRQSCIAPYLLTAESKREKGTKKSIMEDKKAINYFVSNLENTIGNWIHDRDGNAGIYSAKMTEIVTIFNSIAKGEKILVFSSFTSVLDLLALTCDKRLKQFTYLQMDGDTSFSEREEILTKFKGDEYRALFMTYKVGSEGLNITEANHVICIEPWWTPSVRSQAISRCHRPGQTKIVYVYNIYIRSSIEERILKICKLKDNLCNDILEGTARDTQRNTTLDRTMLGKILGFAD